MPVERKNPLFDKSSFSKPINVATPLSVPPKSPVTGKLMQKATCNDVPVWFCQDSRIVLPVGKDSVA